MRVVRMTRKEAARARQRAEKDEANAAKRFVEYADINLRTGGGEGAVMWAAAHLGILYERVVRLRREVSRLKRRVG